MKIGELAGLTGVTVKTIRFYEQSGLLQPPPRTRSNYRVYGSGDVERLTFICRARRCGLSLEEICRVLQLRDQGQQPTRADVAMLDQKLDALDCMEHDLITLRGSLVVWRDSEP